MSLRTKDLVSITHNNLCINDTNVFLRVKNVTAIINSYNSLVKNKVIDKQSSLLHASIMWVEDINKHFIDYTNGGYIQKKYVDGKGDELLKSIGCYDASQLQWLNMQNVYLVKNVKKFIAFRNMDVYNTIK